MGRRIAIALALAALPLGVAAAPAAAKPKPLLKMSTSVRKGHALKKGMRIPSVTTTGFDTALYDGYQAECTAPTGPKGQGPTGQNFLSSETVNVETNDGHLVADCSANLKRTFVKGTTTKVAYNHTAVVFAAIQSCRVYAPTSDTLTAPSKTTPTVAGTGFSVTYPNGLFVETCVATIPPPV
jgi:hypothetical protein